MVYGSSTKGSLCLAHITQHLLITYMGAWRAFKRRRGGSPPPSLPLMHPTPPAHTPYTSPTLQIPPPRPTPPDATTPIAGPQRPAELLLALLGYPWPLGCNRACAPCLRYGRHGDGSAPSPPLAAPRLYPHPGPATFSKLFIGCTHPTQPGKHTLCFSCPLVEALAGDRMDMFSFPCGIAHFPPS
jgi:hypothetical protein